MIELALLPLQASDEMPGMEYYLIGTAVALLIGLGVGYWVYKDASKRGNNELLWAAIVGGLLALLLPVGIIALVAYFIFRGDVVEEEPAGTETAGDSWDTDTTQTDPDDTDW